jgi:hypothetical protein
MQERIDDLELRSARDIVINFLEITLNAGDLSRLDEHRMDLTFALATHPPPAGDAEAWERIAGMAEGMLDERLALLAIELPGALIGVRTSMTLH